MDPKWVPKGVTREPQDTKMNLARFFGDPRPFWEPFWGQWDPKGIPKSSFWGSMQHQRRQKWCSGGVVEKRFEKLEETSSHNECFGGGYNLENRAPV